MKENTIQIEDYKTCRDAPLRAGTLSDFSPPPSNYLSLNSSILDAPMVPHDISTPILSEVSGLVDINISTPNPGEYPLPLLSTPQNQINSIICNTP